MFVVAEHFLSNVIKEYGEHPVSTDGGTWYPSQACSRFLRINHHLHILLLKKALLKEQCNISRIGQKNVLMIIFLVERKNVNSNMLYNG
jgi:hypothetical protein